MLTPRARAPVTACALLLAGGVLPGCYRYAPLPPSAAPTPGSEVRLHLTPEGSSRVAPTLGPQTTVVAGRTEGGAPNGETVGGGDAVSVLVSSTTKAYGGTMRWVGERVTIPVGAIARSEHRVLDRRRTLLAGSGVALAAVVGYALLRATSGGGAGDDVGPPVPAP